MKKIVSHLRFDKKNENDISCLQRSRRDLELASSSSRLIKTGGHLWKKSRCCPILCKEHAHGGHHIWKYGKTHRSTPPGGCQQPQRSPAKHSEAVKPDSGAISGILATGKQILVMWWWFSSGQTSISRISASRSPAPSPPSPQPTLMSQATCWNTTSHFTNLQIPSQKNKPRFHGSHLQILRHSFLYPFQAYLADARTFIACLVGGFFRRWALCIQGEKMGLLGPAVGRGEACNKHPMPT